MKYKIIVIIIKDIIINSTILQIQISQKYNNAYSFIKG